MTSPKSRGRKKKPARDELLREAARVFGSLGGQARAKVLSPAQRKEIAQKGGKARWRRAKRRKQE